MMSFRVSMTSLVANDLWSFGIHPSGLVDTFILAMTIPKQQSTTEIELRQSNIVFEPKQIQAWVSGMREGAGLQWRCRHGWATMGLKTTQPRLLKKTLMEKLCLLPIQACWKQLDSNLVQPRNVWTCGTIFQAMFLPPLAPFLTCSQQFLLTKVFLSWMLGHCDLPSTTTLKTTQITGCRWHVSKGLSRG